MLSKANTKLINSLKIKKYRDSLGLFCAEGEKLIDDLSRAFECRYLVATPEFLATSSVEAETTIEVKTNDELKKISSLTMPHQALAVFHKPTLESHEAWANVGELTLMLDSVQDTGNLGTIIRIADWFGIEKIICSPTTADAYNPKTVQATMGALANVRVVYAELTQVLAKAKRQGIEVYGTFTDGENIYQEPLQRQGIIVMGNEGQGISTEVEELITRRLTIPTFSTKSHRSESLNVATATAIVCSEFLRR